MELENRLGQSKSQYLREASQQPVRWQTYSDEVFRIATELDRPILLDIGAVWCHWCHVMDNESYLDRAVADLINKNFVPVKVDRDQMPDVDARYQAAVGAITGTGGWPLTVFLTPDGKAFYGGTYFPKEDAQGRPGLLTMLPQIAQTYHSRKSEVRQSAEDLFLQLREHERHNVQAGTIGTEIVDGIVKDAESKMDRQFGGFGRTPKFFNATILQLLLEEAPKAKNAEIDEFLKLTLDNIMRGGVYDHIGGGFHRYSVDRYWHVPHFEKMLYDNALMLKVYLKASELIDTPSYSNVARQTSNWIVGPMKSPEGPFYAHQDADVGPHDDGSYWTWTNGELESALTDDEKKAAVLHFDIRETPGDIAEMPDRNVLRIALPDDDIGKSLSKSTEEVRELIASSKRKLLEIRDRKTPPFIDKIIFADRNGLAISALVEASLQLNVREYYRAAEEAADFILEHMVDKSGRVAHAFADSSSAYQGLLDDQVFFGISLLDLFDVMRSDSHIAAAEKIAGVLLDEFEDKDGGGFFDRSADDKGEGYLSSKRKPVDDTPTPSGNSCAAVFFDRLYSVTENKEYFEVAQRTLEASAGSAGRLGLYGANYARALNLHLALRKILK
ncbi:MAG: thioredoxin domain-containing protein [Bacteroidetes bacterium]|nr:thioredoxin domain-containing protein [Bacteroidota bacterium]MCL5267170.1 thioredoxin domain-containing protein [Bacteroidota bacterium]